MKTKTKQQLQGLTFMMLFIMGIVFFSGSVSALDFDNVVRDVDTSKGGYYELIDGTKVGYGDSKVVNIWKTYSPFEVKNTFGFGETLLQGAMTNHTFVCGGDNKCVSELEVYLANDGSIADNIIYERSFDGGLTWISWNGYLGGRMYIENKNRFVEQDIFETVCLDTQTISKNGTIVQECSQVKVGTQTIDTGEFIPYNFGQEDKAGRYKVRIEGVKKSSTLIDWKLVSQGKIIHSHAVWGNISLGDDAEIIINSPANNSVSLTKSVTTNATANITGGAYLTNASLNLSVNGGAWEVVNTTNYLANNKIEPLVTSWASQSLAGDHGWKFTPKYNMNLTSITVYNIGSGDTATLRYDNGTAIATASFSGNTSTFSPARTLSANTAYRITVNDGLGAYYSNTGVLPYSDNFVTVNSGTTTFNYGFEWDYSNIKSMNYTLVLPTQITQTFTNTFNAGDVVDFNYEFCDTDGDCGKSETRRFTIDSTAPTINLSYPTALINYGKLNGTLELNFTATDDNLDSVWYDYNGTNVTIDGAVSGVYNQSNITLTTKKNVTIYANDTAGNLNATTFSWDYKVFETGQSFSPITRAGSIENYEINVTLSPTTTLTSASLIYGSETLSPGIFSSGQNRTIRVSGYETPLYTVDTNVSFYWDLTLDSGNVQTDNNTQLVQAVLIDNCSTHTFNLFNISLFDERAKTPLLGDIQINYQLLNKPTYGVINNISLGLTNVTNVSICSGINLSGENIAYSAEIRYTSDGYASEFYNIQKADIGTSTQTLNLYDLNSNYSTEFKITYQDSSFNFVEGAVVQLLRKYISENLYEIVEAPITSRDGTSILHIDLDSVIYKAIIVKDGVVLDIFDNIVFKCQSELTGECEQKLLGAINPGNDVNQDITRDFAYTITENNNLVTVAFSVPSGSPSSVNIVLNQKDQFGNSYVCNQTVLSSAGSIECSTNATIGDSYVDFNIYKNGQPMATKSYVVLEADSVEWLGENYIIVIILLLSLVGMALSSPEWIVINGIVTLVISGAIYLLNGVDFVVGLEILMWLLIAAGILILKLTKQEDR